MYLLSRFVSSHGVKVVLSGEGADEFLLGYDIFKEAKLRDRLGRRPLTPLRRRLFADLYSYLPERSQHRGLDLLLSELSNGDGSPFASHSLRWRNTARLRQYFTADLQALFDTGYFMDELAASLPGDFAGLSWAARAQHLEIATFLTPYLLAAQGARVAMANALEARFPFLDHRLIELVNTFPPHLKLRNLAEDKYVLRALATAPFRQSSPNARSTRTGPRPRPLSTAPLVTRSSI